jgi:hypothetical protein
MTFTRSIDALTPLLLERSNATTTKLPWIWNPMGVKRDPVAGIVIYGRAALWACGRPVRPDSFG